MMPKCRVWDGEKMVYNVGFTPEGIAYTIPKNAEDSDQFDYYPECPIMQCSGLKDINGNEIYKGDITHNGGVVVFGEGCFMLKTAGDLDMLVRYRVEVIGNIYENPELPL